MIPSNFTIDCYHPVFLSIDTIQFYHPLIRAPWFEFVEHFPNKIKYYVSKYNWKLFTESLFTCPVIGWKTTNHPFFPFDTNDVTQNLDCWRNRLRIHVALHTKKVIPWETLRTWGPKILLLQAFEFLQTNHQNYTELK